MAKAKKAAKAKATKAAPGHYTDKGTRKFQANGPIEWSKVFQRAAGKDGKEGVGIRAAMAYAIAHEGDFLKWIAKAEAAAAKADAKAEGKDFLKWIAKAEAAAAKADAKAEGKGDFLKWIAKAEAAAAKADAKAEGK